MDTSEWTASSSSVGRSGHLIDIDGLAARLGVTERFVRRLVAERRIPFLKIGKFVRFDPDEIDRWVEERRVPLL
ncbi:MAG: helix-turn-helix domain-containing protein [Acidimicrobiales bacterium]